MKMKKWDSSVFSSATLPGTTTEFLTPQFEEYRKGMNINATPANGWGATKVFGTYSANASAENHYVQPPASDFDGFFRTTRLGDNGHFQATTSFRLNRLSPVPRHGQMRPIF